MILSQVQNVGRDLFARGLVSSHSGNLSIRLGDRLIITRRGCQLGCLEEHDLIETGTSTVVTCKTELPEDMVYSMVKTTWENLDQLREANAGFKAWIKENALSFRGIPYHDGAIRYYKDIEVFNPVRGYAAGYRESLDACGN